MAFYKSSNRTVDEVKAKREEYKYKKQLRIEERKQKLISQARLRSERTLEKLIDQIEENSKKW
ncbi:hypothetical protein OAJ23_02290 [Pelagibacteraceae bacterium]|nr:hypothetical protein [Pelagibacteraceae bacterium]